MLVVTEELIWLVICEENFEMVSFTSTSDHSFLPWRNPWSAPSTCASSLPSTVAVPNILLTAQARGGSSISGRARSLPISMVKPLNDKPPAVPASHDPPTPPLNDPELVLSFFFRFVTAFLNAVWNCVLSSVVSLVVVVSE